MMIVRTQDRKAFYTVDKFMGVYIQQGAIDEPEDEIDEDGVLVEEYEGEPCYGVFLLNYSGEVAYLLGYYKREERAIEILSELQECMESEEGYEMPII